jgi:hypothetical protein
MSVPTFPPLITESPEELLQVSYKLFLTQGGSDLNMVNFFSPNFVIGADYGVNQSIWGDDW